MAVRVMVVARRTGEISLAPHRTLDALPHIAEAVVAVPGQVLIEADRDKEGGLAFIRGHGTYHEEDDAAAAIEKEGVREGGRVRLCACNAGVIERVNKLVTVLPPKTRYQGAIGDLVVGRISEVGAKRWKVDLRGHKDAVLQLSAVILPDGLQRIRGHEDVLQMRSFYQEKDLISAEVQNVMSDGTIHLHTRTMRYGKLENGLLVYVRPSLVRRSKHHFITLPRHGVDVILGVNGYVWVSRSLSLSREGVLEGGREGREEELQTGKAEILLALQVDHAARPTTSQERLKIARVRNALLLLDQAFLSISLETIERVCAISEALALPPALLLSPAGAQAILVNLLDEGEVEGRGEEGEKERGMEG